ncbi:beta-mannosidase [Roseibium aquae]|uniref:beta-mannosidase n=2 Tax=Roseibium aquae TaxID=1323746 RepID=A0A916TI38_9HYPH|nr:beta-mannosidase [Roseibium aquae]
MTPSGLELEAPARVLCDHWTLWVTEPGPPGFDLPPEPGPDRIDAQVPGTSAGALHRAGRFDLENPAPLHDKDIWYETRFPAADPGRYRLVFEGLATIADVYLNKQLILTSRGMFTPREVEVTLEPDNHLAIGFRALFPELDKKGPRARWKPQLATSQGLRLVRTTLLGHMPGWCPEVHAVGPWRPITLHRADAPRVHDLRLQSSLKQDGTGTLRFSGRPENLDGTLTLRCAGQQAIMRLQPDGSVLGELSIPDVAAWMPHTHGVPHLHDIELVNGDRTIKLGRTGFRRIDVDRGPDGKGFGLVVNGIRVFCRGAVWTQADLLNLPGGEAAYRPWLELARAAGMNMLRVGGTMTYETRAFFDLCAEFGILVWQDFQFANYDYPVSDPGFAEGVRKEAACQLNLLQGCPSLGVLCGGSEIYQQGAMMGLPESRWKGPLTKDILAEIARDYRPDVPYIENAPSGGAQPFSPNEGIAHYYGVGAYLRPLEDARRAEIRFAAECLAFSHVPDPAVIARAGLGNPGHDPRWKARIPRDRGAGWDFEDVRDHYLRTLYKVEPAEVRYGDPDRYLDLSRAVTCDILEQTFAEWRRGRSGCQGALVWTYQDLMPGAGWGVIDANGRPKPAYYALKRAFRPVTLALTDEGTNGLAVHILNDTPSIRTVALSLVCLRDGTTPVVTGNRDLDLQPHSAMEIPATDLFGAFFDTTYAYRFGPPSHDVTVARLSDRQTGQVCAEAFHFPLGFSQSRHPLGIEGGLSELANGQWQLTLAARRSFRFLQIEADGYSLSDNGFHLAPGADKTIVLTPEAGAAGKVPDCKLWAIDGVGWKTVRGG